MADPVTTVLLVRHGLTALTNSTLVGWTPGVGSTRRVVPRPRPSPNGSAAWR